MFSVFILLVFSVSTAHANTFSVTDLNSLDHSLAYAWQINTTLIPAGQTITGVTLTFTNLYDYTSETNYLYIGLLNTTPYNKGKSGVYSFSDNQNGFQDYFSSQYGANGAQLKVWSDPDGPSTKTTLTVTIDPKYYSWLADGNFTITVDPDCHYYDGGVTLDLCTRPIPEPSTMLLYATGLVALLAFRRKSRAV